MSAEHGRQLIVTSCINLLAGREVDPRIVYGLGGPPARWVVYGGPPWPDYWLRVWAMRGLLWLWDDAATPAVVTALADEAWRVREMAAKVVARHQVDQALESLLLLRHDPVPRVRTATNRAVERLTRAGL